MRPQHKLRNVEARLEREAIQHEASMRPQHKLRNVRMLVYGRYETSTASMRPQHKLRNVTLLGRRSGAVGARFNEAAA